MLLRSFSVSLPTLRTPLTSLLLMLLASLRLAMPELYSPALPYPLRLVLIRLVPRSLSVPSL